ncbi:hypothetical protein [Dehalobacter sp. TeCB1]|uniref:hypothetical protein n=1 Tax=Dehalobacter sp. TeCB1 TaxID=1843715 RepID=UPI00159EF92E|nr:hypothetical protein [Dehalobacter sp. TeCB1]
MENEERQCGTCFRWQESVPGNVPEQHPCQLDGKQRCKNEMKDCLGWKEIKNIPSK